MRFAILLSLLPSLAAAADFVVPAPPASAVIYQQGATIVRTAEIELEAGTHRLLVPVLPTAIGTTRIGLEGAELGAVQTLRQGLVDGRRAFSAVQQAAYDALLAAKEDANRAADAREAALADAEAAAGRLTFLRSVSGSTLEKLDPDSIVATADALANGIRTAQVALSDSRAAFREAERAQQDAATRLSQAERDFEATGGRTEAVSLLALNVTVDEPGPVSLALEDFTPNAGWTQAYDARLTGTVVTLDRKARVQQQSGMSLTDVTLRLSTANPFAASRPSPVFPDLASIRDEKRSGEPVATFDRRSDIAGALFAAPAQLEESIVIADTDGPVVAYDLASLVTVPNGGDPITLQLGSLDFEADLFKRAVPRTDNTAFLMAAIVNNTPEPLLPGEMTIFREGEAIGLASLPLVAAGDDVDIGFGPQTHLQLEFRLLENETGETGIFTTSGQRSQDMVARIRNLSDTPEAVQIRFALPYSEQEDLDIDITVEPQPDRENVEDAQGVAEWDLDVPAGEEVELRIRVGLTWPEGQVLNWHP